jgi:hypothetical protein
MVYYAFFYLVMSYGLILGGNSTNSKCIQIAEETY